MFSLLFLLILKFIDKLFHLLISIFEIKICCSLKFKNNSSLSFIKNLTSILLILKDIIIYSFFEFFNFNNISLFNKKLNDCIMQKLSLIIIIFFSFNILKFINSSKLKKKKLYGFIILFPELNIILRRFKYLYIKDSLRLFLFFES